MQHIINKTKIQVMKNPTYSHMIFNLNYIIRRIYNWLNLVNFESRFESTTLSFLNRYLFNIVNETDFVAAHVILNIEADNWKNKQNKTVINTASCTIHCWNECSTVQIIHCMKCNLHATKIVVTISGTVHTIINFPPILGKFISAA